MSIFKRLSATLVSHIDQVVGEIENHDAVVKATLQDMSKKIAEAKVRLAEVYREQERIQQQIQEQQQHMERWRQRAIQSAKRDENKALECISKRRHCQFQVDKLQQILGQYQHSSEKLTTDIQSSEQRMAELKHKRTLMRARQSTSSALTSSHQDNNDSMQMIDDTFERWEINISQEEMLNQDSPLADPIEREFIVREQHHELREELANLLTEENEK